MLYITLLLGACFRSIPALNVLSANPDKVIEIKATNYDNACDLEAKMGDITYAGPKLDVRRPIASTVTGQKKCEAQKDCRWVHKGQGKGCCVEFEFEYREKTKTWEVPKDKYCFNTVPEDDGAEAKTNDERSDSIGNINGRPLLPWKNANAVWVAMTWYNEDLCSIEKDVDHPIISQRERLILKFSRDKDKIEECKRYDGCWFSSSDGGMSGCCADRRMLITDDVYDGKRVAQLPKQLTCPFVEHSNSETVKSVKAPKKFWEFWIVAPPQTDLCKMEGFFRKNTEGNADHFVEERDIGWRSHMRVTVPAEQELVNKLCEEEGCLWQAYKKTKTTKAYGCCIDPDFKLIEQDWGDDGKENDRR